MTFTALSDARSEPQPAPAPGLSYYDPLPDELEPFPVDELFAQVAALQLQRAEALSANAQLRRALVVVLNTPAVVRASDRKTALWYRDAMTVLSRASR